MDNHSNISDHQLGHSFDKSFAAAVSAYFIFLIVSGVTCNVVLIHAILLKKRQNATSNSFIEQQHSTTNTFVINLAVCDLLTAISTIPFDADFLLRGHYAGGHFICGLKETFFMFSLPASIVNLLLLTGERYIKLLHPFKHSAIFTKVNVAILIVAAWTYILIIALLPIMMHPDPVVIEDGHCHLIFTNAYMLYQLVGNFGVPTLVIVIMNTILYYNVGKRAKAIKKHRRTITRNRSAHYGHENSSSNGSTTSKRQSIITLPINFKAAKTIMTLVGVFLICWLSFIIVISINISCGCLPREMTWIVNAVNYSSVALNPLIYGLLNKSIRQMLVKTYINCCYKGRKHFTLQYSIYNSIYKFKKHSTASNNSDSNTTPNSAILKKRGSSELTNVSADGKSADNGRQDQPIKHGGCGSVIKNGSCVSNGMQYLSVDNNNDEAFQ